MTLSFRDYLYNTVYNPRDAEATIKKAINAAATNRPQTRFPPGRHKWEVGSASLDCLIESSTSNAFLTYGGWMESLSAMLRFNQNYKKVSFAVDLYLRETDAQGHTALYDQGDCYLIC